jgi:hypothetical protein
LLGESFGAWLRFELRLRKLAVGLRLPLQSRRVELFM